MDVEPSTRIKSDRFDTKTEIDVATLQLRCMHVMKRSIRLLSILKSFVLGIGFPFVTLSAVPRAMYGAVVINFFCSNDSPRTIKTPDIYR